jgi:hypothetical protein
MTAETETPRPADQATAARKRARPTLARTIFPRRERAGTFSPVHDLDALLEGVGWVLFKVAGRRPHDRRGRGPAEWHLVLYHDESRQGRLGLLEYAATPGCTCDRGHARGAAPARCKHPLCACRSYEELDAVVAGVVAAIRWRDSPAAMADLVRLRALLADPGDPDVQATWNEFVPTAVQVAEALASAAGA